MNCELFIKFELNWQYHLVQRYLLSFLIIISVMSCKCNKVFNILQFSELM